MRKTVLRVLTICLLLSVAVSQVVPVKNLDGSNASAPPNITNLNGKWTVEGDATVIVEFRNDGFSLIGCNSNNCVYTLNGTQFSSTQACASTKKACTVDNDAKYVKSLQSATQIKIENRKVSFLDKNGQVLIVLNRDSKDFGKVPSGNGTDQGKTWNRDLNKDYTQYHKAGVNQDQGKLIPLNCPIGNPNLIGDWSVKVDTTISISFTKELYSLSGCNANSCKYTLQGNNFSSNQGCISTQRACLVDNDRTYLAALKAAQKVITLGNYAHFYDKDGASVLILIKKPKTN